MGAIAAVIDAAGTRPEDDRAQLADSLVVDVMRLLGADEQTITALVDEAIRV